MEIRKVFRSSSFSVQKIQEGKKSSRKIVVISLGGSLIIPQKMNFVFLKKFKKVLRKNCKTHKFVIVCGGGIIARKYISVLRKERCSKKELAEAGIRATRMNAEFMMQFFGKEANRELPMNMKEVKNDIQKNNFVFCGALRFTPNSTSDSTAAKLAHYLKTDFVNMTNVSGLFTDDPKTFPRAELIEKISWEKFEKMALKLKFKHGQNFVLDQNASSLIKKYKIKTYIIGTTKDLDKIIKNKKFNGTIIKS